MTGTRAPHPDPTDPGVVDVHDFRRAGEFKRVERVVPAADDLRNPMIGIPAGSNLAVTLLLESVIDGVLATGDARYDLVGECSRCLDPIKTTSATNFSELFLWEPPEEIDPDAEPQPLIVDGLLDFGPALHDALVLDLPLAPVCREDCPGLCAQCGARLADDPDHHHEQLDPRWAALAGLEVGADGEADDEAAEGMGDNGP